MTNSKKKGDQGLPWNPPKTMCPFLKDPFDECLCRDMRSMNISAVIRLCGGDYEACVIYLKSVKKAKTEQS